MVGTRTMTLIDWASGVGPDGGERSEPPGDQPFPTSAPGCLPGAGRMAPCGGPMIRTFHHGDFDAGSSRSTSGARPPRLRVPAGARRGGHGRAHRRRSCRPGAESAWSTRSSWSTTTRPTTPPRSPAAGARVVAVGDVLPELGPGEARARRCGSRSRRPRATSSPGATPTSPTSGPASSIGLLGPLLTRSDIGFVKGFYDRPLRRRRTAAAGSPSSSPAR